MEDLTTDGKPAVRKRPVILLVAIAVVGIAVITGLVLLQQKSMFMDYNYTLLMSAKAVNLTCPKMVDEATRLDSVSAKRDRLFSYHYTMISTTKDELDSAFCDRWSESIHNSAKGMRELADFGRERVTLIYKINDKNSVEMCTVTLAPEDYYIPSSN